MSQEGRKLLAITDLETTGLDPRTNEIIEIGLLLVDPGTAEVLKVFETKVKPEHPELIAPEAAALNGYNEKEWREAMTLPEALAEYARRVKDCFFLAYNASFDWSFLEEGFRKTGVANPLDYHPLDLVSMAWLKLRRRGLQHFSLDAVRAFLELPTEPLPHRALTGALYAYQVYRKFLYDGTS